MGSSESEIAKQHTDMEQGRRNVRAGFNRVTRGRRLEIACRSKQFLCRTRKAIVEIGNHLADLHADRVRLAPGHFSVPQLSGVQFPVVAGHHLTDIPRSNLLLASPVSREHPRHDKWIEAVFSHSVSRAIEVDETFLPEHPFPHNTDVLLN